MKTICYSAILICVASIFMTGCSGLAAITVSDTTYSTGIFLDKEKNYEMD